MAQFTYTEDFTGTTAQGWNFVQGSSGQGDTAYLTAARGVDASGQGWLRLASSTANQANAVWFDSPIPAAGASSIQISFSMAMYNQSGSGAGDGIGFFLWDASSTFNAGAYGGSLAYAPKTGIPGLSDGYLGVGFDVYGNYSNPTEGRTGGPGSRPEAVAVRGGPSSGYNNYDYLAGSNTPYNLDFASLTTRPDQSTQYRNVRVTLNPILDGNGNVTGTQVIVEMQFGENGLWQTLLTTNVNGTRPDELRMGFSGATGDAHEIYEINNLAISVTASADSNIWDNSSGNSIWNNSNPTNWYVDYTPSDRANVIFNDSYVTSNQNITLIGTRTISGAYFGGTYSYTINSGAGATLIFDTGVSTQSATIALLNSPTGNTNHQINVPIVMNTDLTVYNYAGQTLTLGGAIGTTTATITMGANNFINQGNGTTVVTSTMSGTGGVFENGAGGRLILAGGNTYTGLTTVSAGALIAASSQALGSTAAGTVVYSGATLGFSNSGTITGEALTVYTGAGDSSQGQIHNIAGTNTWSGTVAMTNSSTVAAAVTMAADAGSTLNITGAISGNTLSGLNKTGDGTIILSGANTYAGATTISGGILQIDTDSRLGTAPASTSAGYLTFNGGTLAVTGNTTLNSNRGIFLDTLSGTINTSTGTTTTYNGVVAGSGDLTKSGGGSLVMTGANTYTGTTTISGGNLIIQGGSSISDNGAVYIANTAGANLVLSTSETIGSLSGGGTTGGNVNLNANTLTVGGNNSSSTFGGVISGTGGVTKNGTGTLVLSGSNTYTGDTTVNNGTLALGNNNVLSNNSSLILNGGTLSVNGYNDTVGTLTLSSSSTIDFGGITSQFTISSANTPTSTSSILLIDNWTGSLAGGSGSQLFLTNSLSTGILSQIQFEGYAVGATRLSTGEVVPSVIANGYYWNNSKTAWGTANAWNNGSGVSVTGVPNATDALAVFGKIDSAGTNASTSTAKTATLSSNATVGYVVFNSTQATENYTITGSSTLTFQVSGTNSAYINMTSTASNLISVPVALSSSLVVSQNGTGTLTLAGTITGNGKGITINGAGNTVISGAISGTGTSLTKNDTGTLTLSGASSYTGGNYLNGGVVSINADNRLGNTGHVTTFSGGTLATTATFSLSGNVTLNSGGGTVDVLSGTTITSSGNYTGTGTLSKNGGGTLILGGANTYTGATNINAGTLVASSTNAIGDTSAVTLANVSGATLALSSSETIGSLSGGGTTGGNVALNGYVLTSGGTNASTTYAGAISGTGGMIKTGTGSLVLNNNSSSYTGTTTISGGEIIMAASNALGTGGVNVASGAMLSLSNSSGISAAATKTLTLNGTGIGGAGSLNNESGNNTWAGAVTLVGNSTIGLNGGNLTVSGAINGNYQLTVGGTYDGVFSGVVSSLSGGLVKTGSGTLTLSGANTYTGVTTVSAGTLAITSNTALGSAAAGTVVANGANLALSNNITVATETLTIAGTGINYGTTRSGAIQSSGSNTITGAVSMSLEPGINVTNGTLTMSGVLSGTSGMSKDGTGTLVLSGNNTFNGAVSVNQGILAVQSNNALGTTSTSVRTTVASGATVQIGTASSLLAIGESFTINGTGYSGNGAIYNSGGNNTISGLITLATDSTIGAATSTTLSATNVINGASLTKVGSGTLILTGTNTYTGSTNINGGTVVVSSDANLGTAPTSTTTDKLTFDGGTLQTGSSFTLNSNRGVTLNSGGGTFNLSNSSAVVSYAGVVAGSGNLTVTGSGTLNLSGNNTYTGTTTVNGATLAIAGDQNLGTAPGSATSNSLNLANGGTLAISNNTTINSNRGITVSGTGGTINTATGTTTTYGGSITGASTLTKSGAGTFALDSDNVISSSTSMILNGGTLATNGHNNSMATLTIAASSTLDMGGLDSNSVFSVTGLYNTNTNTTSGNFLTITNWTGSLDGGTGSQLVSSSTVTGAVLNNINFDGYTNGAYQIAATGEIVPGVFSSAKYWDGGTNTTWNGTASRWNNPDQSTATSIPNTTDQVVVFGAIDAAGTPATNSSSKTVTINNITGSGTTRTVGYMYFNSTYSGENYTITGGTIRFSVSGTTNSATLVMTSAATNTIASAIVLSDSLAITQNGTGTLNLTGNITTNSKNLYIDGSGDTKITGAFGGTTTQVVKTGTGTLTLSGTNSYSGGTVINGGTIAVTAASNLGTTGNALTFSGGTLAANGSFSLSSIITLNSGGGTINTSATNSVTLTGNIIGTGDFTKAGTGTVILNGNNTYSGTTYINGGTLVASSTNAIGNSSAVVLANVTGAQLVLSSSETIGSLSGGGASGGNVNLNGYTLTTGGNNTSTTYGGVISGTGGVTKTGTGTMVLNGNNTYTGATNITQGTLMLGASNAISDSSNVTMAAGTTFAINGYSDTVGTLTLSGNSTLDMGSGVGSTIHFANSAAINWGSNTLTITNYDVTADNDYIYFGTSAAGLSPADIGQIRFLNPVGYAPGLYYAMILSDGRIVPIVPEPSTIIGGLLLTLFILTRLWWLRRQRHPCT